MISALHKEIETLRHRNKELQSQLIMSGATVTDPPEQLPDTETKTPTLPPILTNISTSSVAPIRAEVLDNEIKELQSALHEAKSRNIYLSSVVEQQKK